MLTSQHPETRRCVLQIHTQQVFLQVSPTFHSNTTLPKVCLKFESLHEVNHLVCQSPPPPRLTLETPSQEPLLSNEQSALTIALLNIL